jgi:chloramphenicol 3-O phosphotransferase
VESGRVVLLNGASSSGKSSIGRALLPLLADPWFFVPVDAVGAMRSTVHTRVLAEAEVGEMLRRTRLGYHRAVAALVSVGNDVIMDYPLSERWRLDDQGFRSPALSDPPFFARLSLRRRRHADAAAGGGGAAA